MNVKVIGIALALSSLAVAALPVPPLQFASWQPGLNPGFSDYFPTVVDSLFAAGLADPRGGEYREVELAIPWGQSPWLVTHGWYFPGGFAVCWDGLAHRVTRVGPKAELGKDIPDSNGSAAGRALTVDPISAAQSGYLGVALLLRLGELTLAGRLFEATAHVPPDLPLLRTSAVPPPQFQFNRVHFENAGILWLSHAFHQAVEAHATGDDRLAADISELLVSARPPFEKTWKGLNPGWNRSLPTPTAFLDPVPQLLSDSERRLTEPPREPLNPTALGAMAPSERIATLIEQLEDVSERQFSEPGGVPVLNSPVCKMLVAEGAGAIDQLLDALEHDQRLTRSYGYAPRSFMPGRYLLTVSQVAETILQVNYNRIPFRWQDPAKRRVWLMRNKYRSAAQRYFDLLEDDSNDEIQWLDAANGVLRTGEELRLLTNPSVSDLLAKRVSQMRSNWRDQVAFALYRWDPSASLPTLQSVARSQFPVGTRGYLNAARLQLGDSEAAQDWAATIKGKQSVPLNELTPLWVRPENEVLQDVARQLFTGPNAPMSPSSGRLPWNLLRSPLLIQPVFRGAVIEALASTEVTGTIERHSDGGLTISSGGGGLGCSPQGCGPGFNRLQFVGKRGIRTCDFIAWQLGRIQGFPPFELDAPEEERDRAIARIADFLKTHAEDLRAPIITMNTYPDPVVSVVPKTAP